jgi:hypothetical protein
MNVTARVLGGQGVSSAKAIEIEDIEARVTALEQAAGSSS